MIFEEKDDVGGFEFILSFIFANVNFFFWGRTTSKTIKQNCARAIAVMIILCWVVLPFNFLPAYLPCICNSYLIIYLLSLWIFSLLFIFPYVFLFAVAFCNASIYASRFTLKHSQ